MTAGFLRSTWMLRSEDWQLATNVSGQPVDPIFKGEVVLVNCSVSGLDAGCWDRVRVNTVTGCWDRVRVNTVTGCWDRVRVNTVTGCWDRVRMNTVTDLRKADYLLDERVSAAQYRGADKSLARPTSRCILFDGENISFDASLVI